ncbi:unnamed protein product [Sphagnum jensenii]|uniref:RRM domain-containing protein n=1 Tax=Sphagnum jensenii TaxID=128206 RepID=A0ABP0X1P3_9BRYO
MAHSSSRDGNLLLGSRKLVVLGIPWDIDTEGLRQYMLRFGDLDDVIVMKDRATGRSRGFGYVTFSSAENAQKAVSTQHSLNGRMLEVKIATPREEMKPPAKKITRVFVARIPPIVTDEEFRSYFEKFGALTDAYMPKDLASKAHRGIGFVTYEHSESVDRLMNESHELGGSTIAVDRATPKEDGVKVWGKGYPGTAAYGAYGVYTNAARFGGFGGAFGSAQAGSYGSGTPPIPPLRGLGTKIFVGRLPLEATAEDLRRYFNNFGRISDVYVPKDAKKTSHRGFGFVTFSDEGAAERVALRTHEILGHQIAVDRAAPQDEMANAAYLNHVGPGAAAASTGGAGGPIRGSNAPLPGSGYGGIQGNLDFNAGVSYRGHRGSRLEPRYRPY